MTVLMSCKMALSSIWSSKVRSFLTMLGIIIGVASVIILVNLVTASTISMRTELENMGTNLISVNIFSPPHQTSRSVSVKELETFVEENADLIESMTPLVEDRATVKYGTENFSTSLTGCNENYEIIKNHHIAEGRFISALDCENRKNVVVIGGYVKQQLFGSEDALEQVIKVNGERFTVVGVLENKSTNVSAYSDDDVIIMPYTKAARLIKNANITSFALQGKAADTMTETTEAIEDFLYSKFKSDNFYYVFNQAEIISSIDEALGIMTLLMAGIAGISLIVGGIGIMNIMLVTVTERTREIGIRKAIGAKTGTILLQFLIEAAVISCIGGLIGILLGVGISYLICIAVAELTVVPLANQFGIISAAFLFSAALGVFFGIHPARKAAKLNPIEALRFE